MAMARPKILNVGLVREPRDKHDRAVFDVPGASVRGIGKGPMTVRLFDLLYSSVGRNRHSVMAFSKKLDEGLVCICHDSLKGNG